MAMIKGTGVLSQKDLFAPRSLDRLLLDEANHRVANEVASALAAMRIAQSARDQGARSRMIDMAIDRLEGFGECSRMFAMVPIGASDVGALVERVCRAMLRARGGSGPTRVVLDIASVNVAGETARTVAMIAYELINNALKHAFAKSGGELEVRLEALGGNIILSIIDDGPGLGPGNASVPGGKRLGGRIVGDLVRGYCGSLECETGPNGTAVHVMLPSSPAE